jgi:hypothetical protein
MAHVYLEPPSLSDMCWFCIQRFKTYHIFSGDNGRFYEADDLGSRDVPVNHVRCMLARDLHAKFFVTSKVRKVVIDKVIEAIFQQAKKHAERVRNELSSSDISY